MEVMLGSRPENVVVQAAGKSDVAPQVDRANAINSGAARPDRTPDGQWKSSNFPAMGRWIEMREQNVAHGVAIQIPEKGR